MSRNGSGVYTKVNTFVSGNPVTAAGHNQNWDDIATEITNSVAADGQTSMTGPLKGASGTAGAPGITFASDPDSGLYRIGSNNVGLAVNGAKVLDVATTGLGVTGDMNATTVKQAGFALMPIGVLMPYTASVAPTGWLLCYGQTLSRATYAALWAFAQVQIATGHTFYNNGNGTTTFGISDLRGRVIAGNDGMGGSAANRLTSSFFGSGGVTIGDVGGLESHTLTTAQLATHTHVVTDPGHTHVSGPSNRWVGTSAGDHTAGGVTSPNGSVQMDTFSTISNTTGISNQNAGSGSAHNNVQPTIVCNYIIFAGV